MTAPCPAQPAGLRFLPRLATAGEDSAMAALGAFFHRDMKPDNVFLVDQDGNRDFVKLIDFGIAKSTVTQEAGKDGQPAAAPSAAGSVSGTGSGMPLASLSEESFTSENERTKPGTAIGSPRYMAPEQVRGVDIDGRTDQYAIGCMLYQMLTGTVPFDAKTPIDLMMMHLSQPVMPLRQRCPELQISDHLERTVLRMLAKPREERFPSLREVEQALRKEAGPLPGAELPRRMLLVLVPALLLALAGLGYLGYRFFGPGSATLKAGELAALESSARAVLKEQLQSGAAELRPGAVAGLGLTRDPALRPELEQLLSDPVVRGEAATALGQIGDRKAVPALLKLLGSDSATARVMAARALEQLGEDRGRASLQSLLGAPDEGTRLLAAFALCERMEAPALAVLDAVRNTGKNMMPPIMLLNILYCEARAGQAPAKAELRGFLDESRPRELQLAAAAKLVQLGEPDGRYLLAKAAEKPGPEQLLAARMLASPDEVSTAALFRKVLSDSTASLAARQAAAEGLGFAGQSIDARLLGKQLNAKLEPALRQSAAIAIVRLSQSDPRTLSEHSLRWARDALSDPNAIMRETGAQVLGDSSAAEALPLLTSMLDDSEAQVRRVAARALGRRPEQQALNALRNGLRDPDRNVRLESLRSLVRVAKQMQRQGTLGMQEQASIWFAGVLRDGSPMEQVVARAALLALGDKGQRTQLRAFGTHSDPEVRKAVAELDAQDTDLLAALLADGVAAVRMAAARSLAELGDSRAVSVLREALGRGGADAVAAYAQLVKLHQKVDALSPDGLLGKASFDERKAVIEATPQLPMAMALRLLRLAASDAEPLLRRLTAEVIGELPWPDTADAPPGMAILRSLIDDPNAMVRARASAVLGRLSEAALHRPRTEKSSAKSDDKSDDKSGRSRASGASADGGQAASQLAPAPGSAGAADGGTGQAAMATDAGVRSETTGAENGAEVGAENGAESGRGFLLVSGPAGVLFQLDARGWQTVTGKPIPLPAGPHRITTMSSVVKVQIEDTKTATVELRASAVEELVRSGLEAFERKDSRKAQRLLEKADALCARDRKHAQACAKLTYELTFRLAHVYEAEERWADAMSEYQKLTQPAPGGGASANRGTVEQRAAVQEAIIRLSPRLGQVIFPKRKRGKCQEVTVWLPPGSHLIEVEGDEQTVRVKAKETVHVGSCE